MNAPDKGIAHDSITLTGSYQASDAISMKDFNCLAIEVAYTLAGGETTDVLVIKITGNIDGGATYSDYCTVSDSSGTNTVNVTTVYNVAGASAGTYNKIFIIPEFSMKEFKLSVKETGSPGTAGTATVKYRLSKI